MIVSDQIKYITGMTQIKNNLVTNSRNQSQMNLSRHEQCIVALCTPQGPGALALIRLSGVDAVSVADKLAQLPSRKSLTSQKSHTIHFGYVVDDQEQHIDQVLFLLMKAPRTFTGQDVVEITCHNNQFLVEKIIDRALQCGARLAANGEFAQRAVMTGKMDLVQAEAMNDLIHAQTEESLKYSLGQLEGTFSAWIQSVEQAVLEMLAFCEASFEFLDEEMDFSGDIRTKMDALITKVKELLVTYPKQQYIKEGVRIALVGSVNAGKSSLFNALVNKDRAIVTDIAGTTRDIIESGMYKNGGFLTFVDTAGIRQTDDRIEKEGIDRSFYETKSADIILLVLDGSKELTDEYKVAYQQILDQQKSKVIVVVNKSDQQQVNVLDQLSDSDDVSVVHVSAKEKQNIDELHAALDTKTTALKDAGNVSCLLNQRQYSLLSQFQEGLEAIMPMLQYPVDYELVSYHLRDSLQSLSEMTGRSVREAAMDKVFQSFCVGK